MVGNNVRDRDINSKNVELRVEIDYFILTVFCILFEWRGPKLMSIGDLYKREFRTELKRRIRETFNIIRFSLPGELESCISPSTKL